MATAIVMHPVFSPKATLASLIVTLASVATVTLTVLGPLHHLLDVRHPGLVDNVAAVASIIAALGAVHLSASRSLLPAVDSPGTVTPSTGVS